jgi:hypothetical protein
MERADQQEMRRMWVMAERGWPLIDRNGFQWWLVEVNHKRRGFNMGDSRQAAKDSKATPVSFADLRRTSGPLQVARQRRSEG